jgi:hypothetical protein
MAQDTIYINRDNPVVMIIEGADLTLFTDIKVHFGDDERTLLLNPDSVKVKSPSELELNFQDTTETATQYWCIAGFDAVNTNGVLLNSKTSGGKLFSGVDNNC